jgi:hypothetical protein
VDAFEAIHARWLHIPPKDSRNLAAGPILPPGDSFRRIRIAGNGNVTPKSLTEVEFLECKDVINPKNSIYQGENSGFL